MDQNHLRGAEVLNSLATELGVQLSLVRLLPCLLWEGPWRSAFYAEHINVPPYNNPDGNHLCCGIHHFPEGRSGNFCSQPEPSLARVRAFDGFECLCIQFIYLLLRLGCAFLDGLIK